MTKEQTIYLKGWAILFMMFLHYGTESVWAAYPSIRVGDDWHHAFQICVPLFLFFAGYGLTKGLNVGEKSSYISTKLVAGIQLRRCWKLLKRYWVTVLPFVTVAIMMGKFSFSWEGLWLNMTALGCSWCPNAWFLSLYIELVLMFIILQKVIRLKKRNIVLLIFAILIVTSKGLLFIDWIQDEQTILARQLKMIVLDFAVFAEGMLFARFKVFEYIFNRLSISSISTWGGYLAVALSIAIRAKLPLITMTELLHVPLCIGGLLILSKNRRLTSVITYFGKHSTTIWFIHGYFCWTFLTSITYGIHFWPLSFTFMVFICTVFSAIIEKILLKII